MYFVYSTSIVKTKQKLPNRHNSLSVSIGTCMCKLKEIDILLTCLHKSSPDCILWRKRITAIDVEEDAAADFRLSHLAHKWGFIYLVSQDCDIYSRKTAFQRFEGMAGEQERRRNEARTTLELTGIGTSGNWWSPVEPVVAPALTHARELLNHYGKNQRCAKNTS